MDDPDKRDTRRAVNHRVQVQSLRQRRQGRRRRRSQRPAM